MAVGFTEDGAKRIVEATKYVEKQLRNSPAGNRRGYAPSPLGFWAKITEREGHKYSWQALEPTDEDELEENQDWRSGNHDDDDGYAVEANKSEWVLEDSIVWLEPSRTEGYFIFFYHPGIKTAKLTEGKITKRSGTTPGEGEVTTENLEDGEFTEGEEITVYNPFRSEIEGEEDEDLYLEIGFGDGVWWVVSVDCNTSDSDDDDDGGSSGGGPNL